ncbi:MAG: MarR family winged helix-turn-helix transcriptional regulator [Actinomycetes bacterium]
MRRKVEPVVSREGLSFDRWRVLVRLCAEGPCSMTRLGERTRITAPSLTRAVDRLVEGALAYREVDFEDRRRVLVHVSARGRRLHDRLEPGVRVGQAEALSGLDLADVRALQDAFAYSLSR